MAMAIRIAITIFAAPLLYLLSCGYDGINFMVSLGVPSYVRRSKQKIQGT